MKRLLSLLAVLALLAAPAAFAVNPNERLADPALEARARDLSRELRCLVCQNENIDDSNADLAHDLRVLVRQRLTAGDGDSQVLDFVRSRYGDYVLLDPPMKRATLLLWFGPLAILIVAGIAIFFASRRRAATPPAGPAPLDAEERARLERLMAEGDAP